MTTIDARLALMHATRRPMRSVCCHMIRSSWFINCNTVLSCINFVNRSYHKSIIILIIIMIIIVMGYIRIYIYIFEKI